MRKTRDEKGRISFRLPATERSEAERLARRAGVGLSAYVREAVVEKNRRERGGKRGTSAG
jgi:predicted DNA-binding protein